MLNVGRSKPSGCTYGAWPLPPRRPLPQRLAAPVREAAPWQAPMGDWAPPSRRADAVCADEDRRRGEQGEDDPTNPVLPPVQPFAGRQPGVAVLDDAADLAEPGAVGLADLADVRLDPVAQAEPAVVRAVVARVRVEPADGG